MFDPVFAIRGKTSRKEDSLTSEKRILISGNMGYVGPSVIARLRDRFPDAFLTGVDMSYFGHCLTGATRMPETLLDMQHFADVRALPIDLLKGVDAVVHLAAISNDPMSNAFEKVTFDINYAASVNVAKLARDAGVQSFVFASSCSVYGYAEGAARDEEAALNPLTAYAKSKIRAEESIKDLAAKDFVVTSLRFPTACGMSDRLRLDLVLNDFVAAAVASKRITILSDGTPWRPLIDVKDMARAIDWAINRPFNNGGAFLAINVGRTEWNYQIKDLAEAVREVIPGIDIDLDKNAQPDKRSYRVNFDMYSALAPDHQPQVPLEQSIVELRDGLEACAFSNEHFRSSNYIRLKVLAGLRQRGLLSEQLEWARKARERARHSRARHDL
jgi:nucleoside-diphosphate-sugar epimerase